MEKKKTVKNKVLYFDDEPFITRALAQSLEMFDWDVKLVSDIDDLFYELKTRQFNILILDLMVPVPNMREKFVNFTHKEIVEMDNGINVGIVLAKKIWKELNEDIPILFLSARRDPITKDTELNNHNCAYLRKPQLARTVDEKLHDLLNNITNNAS